MTEALQGHRAKRGTVVGGFELLSRIGQGANGVVYKARQISLDRLVALKILRPSIAQKQPHFVERFVREARVSARLNHANIVQGIEVGQDKASRLYYFAMEFIDGPSVRQLLDQRKVIAEPVALDIVSKIAAALVCAQRAGLVHRDIKPDNILLTAQGDPRLADLGLAKAVEAPESEGEDSAELAPGGGGVTQVGQAVGTPWYMSPEQALGHGDQIDVRADLYALGATLFHMVTGRPPFDARTSKEIMRMHVSAPVPNARVANPGVSAPTSDLIMRLMQKDRARRIQTPEDLIREVEKAVKSAAKIEFPAAASGPRLRAAAPASSRKAPDAARLPRRPRPQLQPQARSRLWLVGGGLAFAGAVVLTVMLAEHLRRPADPRDELTIANKGAHSTPAENAAGPLEEAPPGAPLSPPAADEAPQFLSPDAAAEQPDGAAGQKAIVIEIEETPGVETTATPQLPVRTDRIPEPGGRP